MNKLTPEAKARIKQATKKENTVMKTKLKTTFKYIAVVALTLGVVYAVFNVYQAGYNQGRQDKGVENARVQDQVVSQVKTLKSSEK